MKYKVIFIDLDDTLLDFDGAENLSLRAALKKRNIAVTDDMLAAYKAMNKACWKEYENGIIDKDSCIIKRFELFVDEYKLNETPKSLNEDYLDGLIKYASAIDGAEELLEKIHRGRIICVISNGVKRVQQQKIINSGLGKYFDHIVISDDVGVAKPDERIFTYAHKLAGDYPKSEILMIGDTLNSDIRGGIEYGIDTVWYDFKKTGAMSDATYDVRHLLEIVDIVNG